MPVKDGVGCGPATPFKQWVLDRAAKTIIGRATRVAERRNEPCRILDMTAGPGVDPTGRDGSPLVLARHVQYFQDSGSDIELICVERSDAHLTALDAVLRERYPRLKVTLHTSQAHALRGVHKRAFGLSYWDTTGYGELDTDLLAWHGQHHRFLDILFSRECLAGFRMKRAAHTRDNTRLIDEYLQATGKEFGYIMKYANHGWWSMGFASNDNGWPKLERLTFVDIRSSPGQSLLAELTGEGEGNGYVSMQGSLL